MRNLLVNSRSSAHPPHRRGEMVQVEQSLRYLNDGLLQIFSYKSEEAKPRPSLDWAGSKLDLNTGYSL
jgi:hypothetical protein